MTRIGNNISALMAERRLAQASESLSTSYERLSSGMRINSSSDDAAGLAIADSLRSEARIFGQGIRNLNDGLSALNITQGALEALSSIVTRQQELAAQAANGSYSLSQRKSLHTEANALVKEFNRIVASTTFNGRRLLDSTLAELRIQAGFGVQGSLAFTPGDEFARLVGTGSFVAGYSVGTTSTASANDIVTADLNGDGNLDLITTSLTGTGSAINVSLGNGDGTFRAPASYAAGDNTRSLTLNDFNNDGILDLVSTSSADSVYSVFLGVGDGTFQTRVSHVMGPNFMWYVESADVNGDGNMDLVASDSNSEVVSIRLGNGNGTFRASTSLASSSVAGNDSRRPTLADVNGDGNIDILVTNIDDNNTYLFLGNGNGTFQARRSIGGNVSDPQSVAVRDINEDGIVDLVIGGNNSLQILIGNGDGTFNSFASYATTNITNVKLVDMNGDGIADIVGHRSVGTEILVNLGNGDGTFRAQISTVGGSSLEGIAVGDFDKDGAMDVALARLNAGAQIAVYEGIGTTSMNQESLYLLDQSGARDALETLRGYAERIGKELGAIGAYQSRFSIAAQNLVIYRENIVGAESRIRDVDVAEESAALVRNQILQQAATAILAQASALPKLALELLRE